MIFQINRFGVNIKDAHERTPIHSAFYSSNASNLRSSKLEGQFNPEIHFGDKVSYESIHIFQNRKCS